MTTGQNILRRKHAETGLAWHSKQRNQQQSDELQKPSADGNSVVFEGF